MKTFLMLAALTSMSLTAATTALPITDPSKLGGDVTALAFTVLFAVQFLKRQFERQKRPLPWWGTLLLTLGISEGLAATLFYSGYGARFGSAAPPAAWLLFGLVAAVIAAGGKDLLSGLIERRSTTVGQDQAGAPGQPAALPSSALPTELAPADPSVLPGFQPDAPHTLLGLPTESALPVAALATLRALLGDLLPTSLTREQALTLALRLAPVLPDLADGSAYLSSASRQRVLSVIQDLRAEWGL